MSDQRTWERQIPISPASKDTIALQRMERELAESQARERQLREALYEHPTKWSFNTLVLIAQLLLEVNYPADIFTDGAADNPKADIGAQFVALIRRALQALPEHPGSNVTHQDPASCRTQEQDGRGSTETEGR